MATEHLDTVYRVMGEAKLKGSFLSVGDGAGQLEGKLNGINSALGALGVGIGVAGLNMLSNKMIQAGNYAEEVENKLTAILGKRGESGAKDGLMALSAEMQKLTGQSDEIFTEASSHLLNFGLSVDQVTQLMPGLVGHANIMGQSVEGVADAFGRAFATGRVSALQRIAPAMSEADKEAIKLAMSTSEAAGKQEMFNRVLAAYEQHSLAAGEGISESARAMNYFGQLTGDAQEKIGFGAGRMRARWIGALTPMLESLNDNHQGLLEFAGGVLEVGTQAGNVLAPIWGVTQAVIQMRNAKALATIASRAETGAGMARIPVARAEAIAVNQVAIANRAAAGSAGLLTGAVGASIAVALAAAAAYAVYKSATEWTPDARSLSDEEMEEKGGMAKFTKDAANTSGMKWFGEASTGNWGNIRRGDEAERKIAEINEKRGIKPRPPEPPAAAKGRAEARGNKVKIKFEDIEFDSGEGGDLDDDLISASYG